MFKINHKKGFASIVEVIVTSVIFMIAAVGVFTTISMVNQPSNESARRLEAAYSAKWFMESMRSQVSADTWYSNNAVQNPFITDLVRGGDQTTTRGVYDIGGPDYFWSVRHAQRSYYFTDVPGGGRQLHLNMTYFDTVDD